MKLFICDNGDESVGIRRTYFELDCPFNKEDVDNETLEFFREKQIELFKEFNEGKTTAHYSFETE